MVEMLQKKAIITNDKRVNSVEVRSQYLKIRNLPQKEKRIGSINSKPYVFFCILLLISFYFIRRQVYLLGVLIQVISIYNLCFTHNEKLVEFYRGYVVFYHINEHKDDCFLLFWEDVAGWYFTNGGHGYDAICVELRNQKQVTLRCVERWKIARYFKRCTALKQDAISHIRQL